MAESLDQVLKNLDRAVRDLPTLPHVVERVLAISSSPESSMKDLERVIVTDMALSARILRAANSGLYALPQRITSITQAATILGFRIIRSLCLSIPIMDALGHEWGPLDPRALRRHSLAAGAAARLIARRRRTGDPETAFTAGLLHDVGKILLARALPAPYREVIRGVEAGASFRDAELRAIGTSHDQVGGLMLAHWGLPADLVDAVETHHAPRENSLADVLREANAMATSLGHPCHAVPGRPRPAPDESALAAAVRRAVEDETAVF